MGASWTRTGIVLKTRDGSWVRRISLTARRLVASRLFLLTDLAVLLVLSLIWFETEHGNPVLFLLIIAAVMLAYVELVRRETRWVVELSDLNADLHKALAESDTLAEISKEFSGEIDLEALFDLIARRAKELLGADYSSVAVADEGTGETVWVAGHGFRGDAFSKLRRPSGKGLVGLAMKSGHAVVVEDFGNNPNFPPDEYEYHAAEGMVAALVMPMARGTRALGGLTVGFRTEHTFTGQETDLLEALAAQASIALENAALYAQEKRRVAELAAVLDRMSEGVVVTDSSGRIVRCNEAARHLLGDISPGTDLATPDWQGDLQMLGENGEVVPPGARLLFSAATGEQFTGRQAMIRHGDGRPRHISVDGRPVFNAKGEMVLAVTVIHDITAAREMDLLKDEFLALAAHELKTPLTSIKGYAQMLLSSRASVLGDSTRRALQVMDQQADRVNRMVEQFLLVEEIRSGRLTLNLERIDLADIVARSCARLGSAASAHAVICTVAEGTYVDADERSLGLVLSSLLENALKFSPLGSPVEVVLSVVGSEARLSVRDHGVGIPKDKQGHVFDRFYQVQPGTKKGVGLGLYISQELIANHGGRMWLESREDEGSCFFFAIPLSEARRRAVHE